MPIRMEFPDDYEAGAGLAASVLIHELTKHLLGKKVMSRGEVLEVLESTLFVLEHLRAAFENTARTPQRHIKRVDLARLRIEEMRIAFARPARGKRGRRT